MDLRDALMWLLSGGGAGLAAWYIMERVAFLKNIEELEWKRVAAYAIASSIGILAYLLLVTMLYEAAPATWREWVEKLFNVASIAIISSQLKHGFTNLRNKRMLDLTN